MALDDKNQNKSMDQAKVREDKVRDRASGRILVVDDNEMNRDMLSRRLGRKGFDVDVAADGSEALAKIDSDAFDLVLLDIMMPGISGLEVLSKVRETKPLAELAIIMATAKTGSADIVEALKLGANDYVTKPLDFPVVLARVNAQLSLKRANDEIRRLAAEVEKRNRFIREIFGRYLSDDIVTNLLETPEGLSLGGQKREVTILMCDIRGFSVLSAQLEPTQVVKLVNNFLSVMTEVIIEYGGTIDEFIGDAILVLFGAPVARREHARSAVACAIDMQNAMDEVNRRNQEQGLPGVEMGIGINTGEVVVGNIGSEKRAKYGVVGANVNLAARIESYTVGGQVLISDKTLQALQDTLTVGGHKEVHPKGSETPLLVHEVVGFKGEDNLSLRRDDPNLVRLETPVRVDYVLMRGKDTSDSAQEGKVVRLSATHAELATAAKSVSPMDNLRLSIADENDAPGGALFAKVVSVENDLALLRFTALSDEQRAWITQILS